MSFGSSKVHGADLDTDKLPGALRIPPVQREMEVLRMLTQSDLERERYESRLKAQRDHFTYLKHARQEGREEGETVGRILLCQRLLKLPLTPREELLALPLAELQSRAAALEQQLGVGGQ